MKINWRNFGLMFLLCFAGQTLLTLIFGPLGFFASALIGVAVAVGMINCGYDIFARDEDK